MLGWNDSVHRESALFIRQVQVHPHLLIVPQRAVAAKGGHLERVVRPEVAHGARRALRRGRALGALKKQLNVILCIYRSKREEACCSVSA